MPDSSEAASMRARRFDGVPREPGARKPDPILVADGVSRKFGGLTAVDVDHFEIERGCITGLIGPNGAGKTTFFNLLTGFDKATTGEWTFDGEPAQGVVPNKLALRGMVRTFQLTKVLSKMTVIDNMLLGGQHQRGESLAVAAFPWLWRDQERELTERADALLERFRMDHMRNEYAGALSGGQRKLLEMARALMSEPKLIMLDEPMAGVNPALTESLLGHVKALRDEGVSVLFVEHDMDVVRDISDWVVVMAEGRVIAEGRHADIAANPAVIEAYLGGHHGTDLAERVDAERASNAADAAATESGGQRSGRPAGDTDDAAGEPA